jgi:ADP-L-glycero-D-manno-heptose 6-epimerase
LPILLTGGAGFIGSCLLRTLNENGYKEIIVVDDIGSTDKWKLLANKTFIEYFHKNDFYNISSNIKNISLVIHLGACSRTTERDFDYLYKNNFVCSKLLWDFCVKANIPYIYASSASTYGNGSCGFDDRSDITKLRPLNGYGYSKQLFDLWVRKQLVKPPQSVGLKFFNVYGPNEYFKNDMASIVFQGYHQLMNDHCIRLFKSYDNNYDDGEQTRDFVYVKDVCKVILFFIRHKEISGLFNVATGQAKSFNSLAEILSSVCNVKPNIQYIDMPKSIRKQYQYFTQANIGKLRSVGYEEPFMDLRAGIYDYVKMHLLKNLKIY